MRTSWRLRNRAPFAALLDGNVFAVRGDWWVGELDGHRVRAKWRRKRVSHR